MRSPALVSRSSNPERHAVLALLSERYPPLRGRSPTCYSPVRHSTQGRSPFRVRLACVRHAASVDSEPGSNSHVKGVVRFRTLPADSRRAFQILPRPSSTKGLWLFCFLSCIGERQSSRLLPPSRALRSAPTPTPPADTRRAGFAPTRALRGRRRNVCTLYLVFKEPRLRRPSHRPRPFGIPEPPSLSLRWRPLGEPFELTTPIRACQPFLRHAQQVSVNRGVAKPGRRSERTFTASAMRHATQRPRPKAPRQAHLRYYDRSHVSTLSTLPQSYGRITAIVSLVTTPLTTRDRAGARAAPSAAR